MTESEAIEILKGKFPKWAYEGIYRDEDKYEYEMAQLAIKELEKQTPKKPTYVGDGYAPDGTFVWDEWLCPCCGIRYEVDYDEHDFCPNCGQKIDWSVMP